MIWWWKEGLKRREGGRKSMSQHNLSLKGDRRKTCVWADNERFSAFQREIKRCIIIAVGIIWRIFPHILKETFSNGLDYHCKVFKVMFTYLILKRDNPVLLGLHVVPALAECRVEIINIWCLDFIRVAQGESCRVSPWPKVTKGDQRHQSLWSHEGFSPQLSYRLVTWTGVSGDPQSSSDTSPMGSSHLLHSCSSTGYFLSNGGGHSATSTKFYKTRFWLYNCH